MEVLIKGLDNIKDLDLSGNMMNFKTLNTFLNYLKENNSIRKLNLSCKN
jgi:hypothetical protein